MYPAIIISNMKTPRPATDTRRMRRELDRRLLVFVVFFLVVVGSALIALSYGTSAALVGFGCLLAGAGLIGLLWWIFTLLGRWAGADR